MIGAILSEDSPRSIIWTAHGVACRPGQCAGVFTDCLRLDFAKMLTSSAATMAATALGRL